jgi:two-component system sensor histidine kinase QseC
MIRSIRQFLLISLLISITIASSITAIGNYLLDKQVIQPYLDEQLTKTYAFVVLLEETAHSNVQFQEKVIHYFNQEAHHKHHLLFQVWSPSGKLLISAPNTFTKSLKDSPVGFSDDVVGGNDWRVYAAFDQEKNKIIVAELYDIRNQLADNITQNNAYILLVTYPLFGVLIWIIVGLALRSITRVSNEISNRASTYLEPVTQTNIPLEIKPLVDELNQLFIRLKLAFDRNKRFAGDAAHELRTPLAALKTHAQVALKSENEAERDNALIKVIQSVDRSTHIVAQLLTLSRLNQEDALNDVKPVDLHRLTTEIVAYLVPVAVEKQIEIELDSPPAHTMIMGNDIALGILIRNVVDNAIRYTPEKGEVKIRIINQAAEIILRVTDSGPGVPVELRERIFERFYRVIGTKASGSGLGLAIVSQIAELHNAHISLSTPANGVGLQFDVAFPGMSTQELS